MLLDDTYGRQALFAAAKADLWIGRPVEQPGSRPLRFEGSDEIGARLVEWPASHTIKCLVFYHPDDDPALKAEQIRKLGGLHDAARRLNRELLVEIIAGRHGPMAEDTVARAIEELYAAGHQARLVEARAAKIQGGMAQHCAGDRGRRQMVPRHRCSWASKRRPRSSKPILRLRRRFALVKGFAIGRTIFNHAAQEWLKGGIKDEEAIKEMAQGFGQLASAGSGCAALDAA